MINLTRYFYTRIRACEHASVVFYAVRYIFCEGDITIFDGDMQIREYGNLDQS